MTVNAEALKTQLDQLSVLERAELASYLIDSLEPGKDPDARAAWDIELRRRSAEILRGDVEGEPAEQLFARLRTDFQ